MGLDPVRVLLLGSGLAVGYGVDTHEKALTGALARAIRGGSSRGVIVLNRTAVMKSVEQTVAGLGLDLGYLGGRTRPRRTQQSIEVGLLPETPPRVADRVRHQFPGRPLAFVTSRRARAL